MASSDLLLPPGAVLFHIGPYKTGTTSLQASLFAARDGFAEHGVYYPGKWRRAMREGWALIQWTPAGRRDPDPVGYWEDFAHDIRDHADMRSCLSSEDLAATRAELAQKAVEDLGGDRVHIVMVLRRFDRLLPSMWQERVKGWDRRTYAEWLHEVLLEDDEAQAHRAFWRAQDVARVAGNWLTAVPPDRFHVIIADETDRDRLPRTFEQMLGLPERMLVPQDIDNASLNANAAELVRRMNVRFAQRDWPERLQFHSIYKGAAEQMMHTPRTSVDVGIPPLPEWAVEPLRALSDKRIADVAELGLDVIGDPELLRLPESVAEEARETPFPDAISLDQAEAALYGAIAGTLKHSREKAREQAARRDAEPGSRPVSEVPARELARIIAKRVASRVDPRRS